MEVWSIVFVENYGGYQINIALWQLTRLEACLQRFGNNFVIFCSPSNHSPSRLSRNSYVENFANRYYTMLHSDAKNVFSQRYLSEGPLFPPQNSVFFTIPVVCIHIYICVRVWQFTWIEQIYIKEIQKHSKPYGYVFLLKVDIELTITRS